LESDEPSLFVVGAAHDRLAEPLAVCTTAIANGASDVVALPSLTEMMMLT
jgi:hypothetical protein